MPVGNLGPEEVVTANRDATLSDIAQTLATENVGAVVIVEDSAPVGLVTDRDVALALTDGEDVASRSVEEVMTEDPVTIQQDEEAIAVARTIGEHHVRRIPVVDGDGNLTGIVSLDDVVAVAGEQLEEVSDTIESQSPNYSP